MALDAELETKILRLCEEANSMLLANLLDQRKAAVLRKRLLECHAQARDAGYATGEEQLLRLAEQLAEKFPQVGE